MTLNNQKSYNTIATTVLSVYKHVKNDNNPEADKFEEFINKLGKELVNNGITSLDDFNNCFSALTMTGMENQTKTFEMLETIENTTTEADRLKEFDTLIDFMCKIFYVA